MEHLRIVVLGAGNIGGTLGRALGVAGHQVVFGVRDQQSAKAQAVIQGVGSNVELSLIEDSFKSDPQVVIIAIPGGSVDATIAAYAAQLDGRIIIDAANRPAGGPTNSLGSLQTYTPHAQTYRAFNTLGWENFARPLFNGVRADLFYCGPEGESKVRVEQLISDVGLRPIYVGGSEEAGLVDSILPLWAALAFKQRRGRHLAFKLLDD